MLEAHYGRLPFSDKGKCTNAGQRSLSDSDSDITRRLVEPMKGTDDRRLYFWWIKMGAQGVRRKFGR